MPRYWEILNIARVTIDTLKKIGIPHCCFIGGMACKLYTNGKGRQPKDLDILCFTPWTDDAEVIKRRLLQEDDHFYTERSKNPRNRFRILYYRVDSNDPDFKKFKIDILLPGILDLPDIHPDYIIKIKKYPCAPLVLLLLHKLKAWDDRRQSRRQYQVVKAPEDVRDIRDLLRIANRHRLRLIKHRDYISHAFRAESYERVKEFSEEHPQYTQLWMGLGLDHLFDELM